MTDPNQPPDIPDEHTRATHAEDGPGASPMIPDELSGEPAGEGVDGEAGPAAARSRRRLPRPGRVAGFVATAAAGAVLTAAVFLATGVGGRSPAASPSAASPSATASASTTPAPSSVIQSPDTVAQGAILGSAGAPVTVEIWADYQCPFCRAESAAFGGALEREYVQSGAVRIVYRDFAFLGQESLDSAVAARCAGRQDPSAYWRYHDLLFVQQQGENQGAFSAKNLLALAALAGLDDAAFSACLKDPAVLKGVTDETAVGRTLDVASTPTLRIIGPYGTQVLSGFTTAGWPAVTSALHAVASPAPSRGPASSGSPLSGSPGPSAAGSQPAASPGEPSPSAASTPAAASPAP